MKLPQVGHLMVQKGTTGGTFLTRSLTGECLFDGNPDLFEVIGLFDI